MITLAAKLTEPDEAQLDPCWWWVGRIDQGGHARQGEDFVDRLVCQATTGRRFGARAYRVRIGRLCHDRVPSCPDSRLCPHRSCVNPSHLTVITLPRRPRKPPRTHCGEGHELTPENTYIPADECRRCRTCRRKRLNPQVGAGT